MAITVALAVDPRPNVLRYLATHDGAATGDTVTIPNAGGVTPDLQTDIAAQAAYLLEEVAPDHQWPLAKLINANRTGLGAVTAGAMTQAQARALFNSDDAAGAVLVSNLVPRARVKLIPRLNNTIVWTVDVNVDGNQNPVIVVSTNTNAAAECYVDLHFRFTDEL